MVIKCRDCYLFVLEYLLKRKLNFTSVNYLENSGVFITLAIFQTLVNLPRYQRTGYPTFYRYETSTQQQGNVTTQVDFNIYFFRILSLTRIFGYLIIWANTEKTSIMPLKKLLRQLTRLASPSCVSFQLTLANTQLDEAGKVQTRLDF